MIRPGSAAAAAANAEEEGEKTLSLGRFVPFRNVRQRRSDGARAHAARQSRTAILRTPPTRSPRTERKDRSINDDPAKRVFHTEFEIKFHFLDVLLGLIETLIIIQCLKQYATNKQLLYCIGIYRINTLLMRTVYDIGV